MKAIFNNLAKICCALLSVFIAIVGIVFFKADIKTIVIMIFFFLFYVLIPGIAILENINMRCDHLSTKVVRSFFIGFALNVALYYLAYITGLKVLLYFISPIIAVIWLFTNFRLNPFFVVNSSRRILSRLPVSFYVFFVFVFLYSVLTTQCVYISPEYCSFSAIKLDFGFHAGIINALSSGYPPDNPWVYHRIIHYHYFSELLLSIPVSLFKLTSEEVLLSGTPYFLAPVFSISLYSFFREYSLRKERAGLYCLAFHISNMFILKSFPSSWFLYHIYSNINNTGLGISCLLVILVILKKWDSNTLKTLHVKGNDYFVLAILVMLLTGIKGPIAAVLVGAMIGALLLGFILKSISRHSLAATVLSSISFTLIYVFVLGSQHSSGDSGALINIGEVTDLFFLKSNVQESADSIGLPNAISLLILFSVFLAFFLSTFLLPFIVGYLRELFLVITQRKEFCFSRVIIYACCMVGFLAMMILDFSGHSQVYFGFATLSLVPLVSFWFFEEFSDNKVKTVEIIKYIFAICMFVSVITTFIYIKDSCVGAYDFYNSRNDDSSHYRNVSTEEYEGLIWIKNNTSRNSLIASDRYYSVSLDEYSFSRRNNNNHFAYAIYSQRKHYLEGSGFSLEDSEAELRKEMIDTNNQLYQPDNKNRGSLARSLGIDYVIVSKRFNKVNNLENSDYILCFTNKDMDIYKIRTNN